MKFFKILFSLFFVLITITWILFTVETLFPEDLQIFSKWDFFQNDVLPKIKESYSHINSTNGELGYQIVLYSGAIFLGYTSLIFLIEKIPFIGGFIKSLTGFISFFSIVAIVVGSLLWVGII